MSTPRALEALWLAAWIDGLERMANAPAERPAAGPAPIPAPRVPNPDAER